MFTPMKRFSIDNRASDALPMRMVVAVIAMGFLIILLSVAISSLIEKEEIHATEAVVSDIVAHAEQMSSRGAGSVVTLDIHIPSNARIVMGAMPDDEDAWPLDSQNYYFLINDKQFIMVSNAFYANSMLSGCFVIGPGQHIITLESVRDQNGKILITLDDKSQVQ